MPFEPHPFGDSRMNPPRFLFPQKTQCFLALNDPQITLKVPPSVLCIDFLLIAPPGPLGSVGWNFSGASAMCLIHFPLSKSEDFLALLLSLANFSLLRLPLPLCCRTRVGVFLLRQDHTLPAFPFSLRRFLSHPTPPPFSKGAYPIRLVLVAPH